MSDEKRSFGEILGEISPKINWRLSLVGGNLTVFSQPQDTYFEELCAGACKMEIRALMDGATPSIVASVMQAILEEKDRLIDQEVFHTTRRTCIGFLNGVFDLRTGKMRAYQPSDFILSPLPHHVPTEFNKECETWYQKIIDGWVSPEVGKWFTDLLSYFLFSFPNTESIWTDFFGQGANGKSVCLQLLNLILGNDKCIGCDLQNLNRFSGDAVRGKWLVIGRDSSEYVSDKAVSFIKTYTGDERLLIERKGGNSQDVTNTGKLIVSTNHLIKSKDRSHAWYRRILPVQFPYTFKQDDGFKESLFKRIPDIIRVLLHKAHLYYHNKTSLLESVPEPVRELREETRKQNDRIMAFWEGYFYQIDERDSQHPFTVENPDAFLKLHGMKMSEVYEEYKNWHKNEWGNDLPVEPSLTSFGGQYGAFMSCPAGKLYEMKRHGDGRKVELREAKYLSLIEERERRARAAMKSQPKETPFD